ncbi:MAG: ATP-dependent helicase/nuclease subunit [Alphaproteobacteria bacterium]|jgi:ATP-dependent helicase/nuclease subunit B|nr:ATP-dependent helicase/nuclease subunit [Alphaproteobacteria bacterium]
MPNPSPRVFTIPASAPFLPTLIAALVEGRLVPGFAGDPLTLSSATLYLPTRRACRLARDVFLDVLKTDAAILPRIVPIGDVDEDEIAFAEAATGDLAAAALGLPEALGGLERRLLLAELVLKWARAISDADKGHAPLVANNPAAALALADDLARLMDDMTTRQVSFEKLDGLVPRDVDDYWQLTLRFLKIARETWPAILAERGKIEPAARRDLLIAAEAARLEQTEGPVIAAGSTGSMPATAKLLATIAKLPHGAVVLPGLDTDLDEPSWDLIGGSAEQDLPPAAGHPQFAMHGLLQRMGIRREQVGALIEPAAHGRELFTSEALRPAATTDLWREKLAAPDFSTHAERALGSLSVVEAANAEEEALAIAVALREAVETPEMTAALITPDRGLARRVLAALARWNVPVDDSGGDALPDTPAGVFARLAADAALGGLAPVTLLALLKHPLLRLGAREGEHREAAAVLEQAILRGPRPSAGTSGLARALANFREQRDTLYRGDPRRQLADAQLDAASILVDRLAAALAPLEKLPPNSIFFAEITARHRDVVRALGGDAENNIDAFAGTAGTALGTVFEEIATSLPAAGFSIGLGDYPDLFRGAIADRVVRRPKLPGVRIRIYGPLEARLQSIDRVVLGGLVEGTWPPETRSDPWLNRPMRHDLDLDLPERRIGLSAHDFVQAVGGKEVILTRAAKLAGAPTVASRFVQRLAAVAGRAGWEEALERGARYLTLARVVDAPVQIARIPRPEPKPPLEARPTLLSVTEIEHWLRDPYTIYAKHVLRLAPLEAVDTPPGAADRGTVIHAALGEFTQNFAGGLPTDPASELIKLGRKHFAALDAYPEARAFWWPRFERIARWFAEWETERRQHIAALHAEIRGEIRIPVGKRVFRLSARADRIERLTDGRYAVLDYKTGAARTEKQVRTGLAPQLTLEAAILRGGGFAGVPNGASVAELVYVALRGVNPPGEACRIDFKDGSAPDIHADRALTRLTEIAIRFEHEDTPYRSLVHPMWKVHYGDYDHLARVKEWSATGGLSDEGGGE